jgi:hypothetical protein
MIEVNSIPTRLAPITSAVTETNLRESTSKMQDFSKPVTFELSKEKPDKTVDIGRDGTSVSTDPRGQVSPQWLFYFTS